MISLSVIKMYAVGAPSLEQTFPSNSCRVFFSVCVNCRSSGQRGDGPRGLPFPPLLPLLCSHYTLHSQTSNSPSEPTSVCPDSQCCCAHTHTKQPHTQRCRNTRTCGTWQQVHFFMIWWPVATFPLSTTAPNIQEVCFQLATTQSQGLRGVFIWL